MFRRLEIKKEKNRNVKILEIKKRNRFECQEDQKNRNVKKIRIKKRETKIL